MASVNKVILIGHLGADPELRFTPNGNKAVCNLRIATSEVFKDKSGQKQESTEWHRVTVWGDQAENCNKYLAKGRSVYVEGRLQTRAWDDKDGVKKYSTDIVAERVKFLGGGGNGERGSKSDGGGGDGGRSWRDEAAGAVSDLGMPPGDDDIPFIYQE